MLDPDYLEAAGDLVGSVYQGIESELLDDLISAMLAGKPLDQTNYTELALMAQTHTQELQGIVDSHRGEIDEAVSQTVNNYLKAADTEDMARAGGEALWPKQVQATITGISTVLARDNIDMVEGAKTTFLNASAKACTLVNTGVSTTEHALHRAVREIENYGIHTSEVIKSIDYKSESTGVHTVSNQVDVAVRRHIRTQIAQDAGHMTESRLDSEGVDLVEVSSHAGARPSHAVWQGRCYSRTGEKTIGGVVYKDFRSSTGYGTGAGLCGWNCRHSYGPYRHGAKRAYAHDPKSDTGLPSTEVYKLTQKQRAKERDIRSAKREQNGAQLIYDADNTPGNLANLNAAKDKLKREQASMRKLISTSNARCKPGTKVLHRNPKREWAGDMPDVKTAIKQTPRAKNVEISRASPKVGAPTCPAGLTLESRRRARLTCPRTPR